MDGGGLLDAAAMLSATTLAAVQTAYARNQLPQVAPDTVSLPLWWLLFGLDPPGPGVDEMDETEAAQIFWRSANKELAAAVEANPNGDPAKPLAPADARKLRDSFIAEPSISNAPKAHLHTQAAKPP